MLIFLNLTVGVLRSTETASRVSAPAFNAPKSLMPMHDWGWPFLLIGLGFIVLALLDGSRPWITRTVSGIGLGYWVFWVVLAAASAHADPPHASYVGSVLYVAGAARHFQAFRRAG
jgi:hypothetical protein